MLHHAILITAYSDDRFDELCDAVHRIYGSDCYAESASCQWNGYRHLLIPPDGSKEGWRESDQGDSYRDQVIEWLESKRFDDSGSPYAWVEVQYGDEYSRESKVLRSSDQPTPFDKSSKLK
jgi:hypothetical protein